MNSEVKRVEKQAAAPSTATKRVQATPLARVVEGSDAYELKVELPGVDERDLRIDIEHRTLTVEGDSTVVERKGQRLVHEEFAPAAFRAVYELPEQVEAAAVTAKLVQGILTLTLPKREEVKPRRIAVNL